MANTLSHLPRAELTIPPWQPLPLPLPRPGTEGLDLLGEAVVRLLLRNRRFIGALSESQRLEPPPEEHPLRTFCRIDRELLVVHAGLAAGDLPAGAVPALTRTLTARVTRLTGLRAQILGELACQERIDLIARLEQESARTEEQLGFEKIGRRLLAPAVSPEALEEALHELVEAYLDKVFDTAELAAMGGRAAVEAVFRQVAADLAPELAAAFRVPLGATPDALSPAPAPGRQPPGRATSRPAPPGRAGDAPGAGCQR